MLGAQVLLALAHMHNRRPKVIHRDIKSLNMVLDSAGDVLLGDMGIARAMSPSTLFALTQATGLPPSDVLPRHARPSCAMSAKSAATHSGVCGLHAVSKLRHDGA